jgi:phasin family protein
LQCKNILDSFVRCTYIADGSDFRTRQPIGELMFTTVEDFQKFGKQQFDAMTAASTSMSKGLQEIASEATDYSRKTIEANTAAIEKLLGARSLDSAIQIQTDYAKSSYESLLAQTTRMGELFSKLARDAFKPVESAYVAAK